MPIRLEPAEEHYFRGDINVRLIEGLPLIDIAAAGQRATWTRCETARSPDPFCAACLHLEGTVCVTAERMHRQLSYGDVLLLDSLREFRLGLERCHRDLIVKLPRQWLEARLARPDLVGCTVLPHNHPCVRLFAGYLAGASKSADQFSPASATMCATHLLDLLAGAFADSYQCEPAVSEASRAALFVRACRLISLNFSDPDFQPDRLARTLGISTRTLHRIFAEHNTTVMKHLLAERVSRAAKLLAAPEAGRRTITDIAFACGFNDLSHFGRVFESQMGVPPSQWRRERTELWLPSCTESAPTSHCRPKASD
jgi:AraC-like DNA-binding protein